MKGEYDEFQDNDEFQHVGLGAGRKNKMSKNEQIYGDFYQAYEEEPKMTSKPKFQKSYGGSYSRFKAGSTIQNYAAECDVHIPEPKPKKKVKTQQMQEEQQEPEIGQFNLQSFLTNFQQKEELQKIQEESDEQSYNGPFCLHSKVKSNLKLVKIGQQQDLSDFNEAGQMNLNEMTFEQYRKLVMRNGKKEEQQTKKKLTPQEKEKEKEFIESYGKGYSMLEKMGFNLAKGLGKEEKGITKPVEAVFKTAFTTKDSQLKEEESKEQETQTQEDEIPAETALFQYRSRNIKLNNFLLDLKNKFESITSKMYFYERQVSNFDRDFEINQSLKLQKHNQIQQHEEEIKKLSSIKEFGKNRYEKQSIDHNQELKLKHIYPHLALKYKMDLLFVKNEYLRLKSMNDTALYEAFPGVIKQIHRFLNNFYLDKERETIKGFQEGLKNFKDSQNKVVNLDEDVIDLVDDRPTEPETITSVSIEDSQKITRMIELIAENTIITKINQVFTTYMQIEDIKNFKVLECLRVLKQLNKNSELVQTLINKKIKPLIFNYYNRFDSQQIFPGKKDGKQPPKQQISQNLPHLIIFPLFEIMDPVEMQLGKLLNALSKKLWNLKSPTLFNILKPILQYCPSDQKDHFINFYLAPRLLYHLEEFDLTQPHICKELMSNFKLYRQLFPQEILKDLLNSTIIPEIVMTYRKYEGQGTSEKDLSQWAERWVKQIGKIVPNYLQEVLINDFNIRL